MFRPAIRFARLILWANLIIGAVLLLGLATLLLPNYESKAPGQELESSAQQAQSVMGLLTSELDRVRGETRAAAELATHIFTNPESYRLAAQPGEYDYDQATGLYGSARNDGSSVVFLSTASALNPEILREIRLSEYLNPVFRTSAGLNPLNRSITLYTTDGLVRSYPWFDFKSRVVSGALKRNFSVTELSFFPRAMPSRNPSKEGVWAAHGSQNGEVRLVCAAPFLAGDSFRGVIAIEVDSEKLAAQLFRNLEPRETLGLLLAEGERVLGTSRKSDAGRQLNGLLPGVLKDLKVPGLAELEPLLKRLAQDDGFAGSQAGFRVGVAMAPGLPVKPVLIVPEDAVARLQRPVQKARVSLIWMLIGVGLACGLLLVDAKWIGEMRHDLQESEKKLSDYFTALSDLNLHSALIATPQGMLSAVYPRLDEGMISSQKALEAGPMAPASDETSALAEEVDRDPTQIELQSTLFQAFDAHDSAGRNLNRLAAALRAAFEVQRVSFWSYSESALRILPLDDSSSTERPKIEWKQGPLFVALNGSQTVVSSNSLVLDAEEQQVLCSAIQGNYLAAPLWDAERLLGVVVLSDKPSGISLDDETRLEALQVILAKVVQNIYQCDRLAKLNRLRREYCLEFVKAVEAPLDRIRAEVQTIYARLGKLTPYYKQHCETILFEVGKLYEIMREAQEGETTELNAPGQTPSSEDGLAIVKEKDHE